LKLSVAYWPDTFKDHTMVERCKARVCHPKSGEGFQRLSMSHNKPTHCSFVRFVRSLFGTISPHFPRLSPRGSNFGSFSTPSLTLVLHNSHVPHADQCNFRSEALPEEDKTQNCTRDALLLVGVMRVTFSPF
jgi:hypothetical protein